MTLRFDKPITFQRIGSPLSGQISRFSYKKEQGGQIPKPYPYATLGGCFGAKALRFSHENASQYVTLLPGTPHEFCYSFGLNKDPRRRDEISIKNLGLNGTETGKSYVLGVWPKLKLPAWIGTKDSLLSRLDAGEGLKECSVSRHFGHSLPLLGGPEVHFKVVE